mgnify:CR=1 FL=1
MSFLVVNQLNSSARQASVEVAWTSRAFRLLSALNTEGGNSHITIDSDDLLALSLIPISDT